MPNSHSVPHVKILSKASESDSFHSFLPLDKLADVFKSSGIEPTKPIVTSCGSGVTGNFRIFY